MRELLTCGVVVASLALFGCSNDETNAATEAGGSGGTGGQGGGGGAGARGGDVGDPPDWSCLGSVTWDPPATATIAYNVTFVSFLAEDPLPGVVAKACPHGDTVCATPVAESTADGNGTVMMTLPTGTDGFDGYIEVTGDGVKWLNFYDEPLIEDQDHTEGIVVDAELITVAALLSTTVDDADGHLAFGVDECGSGDPSGAQAVTTNTDGDTLLGYVVGQIISADVDRTDESGFGAFINMPPGDSTITATVADSGEQIGTADVFIRAGFTSFVYLPPSP